uniref:Uncharacterized protein n=1 Tax=Kalanchoe fedtschenkoi TaxID=63787 RepID=A0A7N0THX8_KALFE
MAKVSSISLLFAFLLFSAVSVNVVASQGEAAAGGRCQVVLRASGCDLPTCRQQCYQQLHGDGQCVAAPGGGLNPPYKCVCFYNC